MNAARNPFRSDRIEALRFRFPAQLDHEALRIRWGNCGRRGAIVGPEGTGKTTLLLEVADRLRREGERVVWVTVRTGSGTGWRSILAVPAGGVVLLEGGERLGALGRLLVRFRLRCWHGFLMTAHAPAFVPTILRTATTPELVAELVRDLDAETARTAPVAALWERHGGNARGVFGALYDRAASAPG